MRRVMPAIVFLLAVALAAVPAFALGAFANFQGSCVSATKTCTFNASLPAGNPSACSSPGEFIIQWDWTFTNPAGSSSGNPKSYVFNANTASVTLKITCSDGREDTETRTVCFLGGVGCIQPDIGYN
jgi:hypothetical protein